MGGALNNFPLPLTLTLTCPQAGNTIWRLGSFGQLTLWGWGGKGGVTVKKSRTLCQKLFELKHISHEYREGVGLATLDARAVVGPVR